MITLSFSPWQMFMNANLVVQSVMIVLILGGLLSWTICFAKTVELLLLNHNLLIDRSRLQKAKQLDLDLDLPAKGIGKTMMMAVREEYQYSGTVSQDPEGIKERIALLLERIESNEGHRLNRGTGLLATIGSIAPFVGLFGTVWGIMTSFTGIAEAQTTSLMVVAPGIAEALLATALGLVTAIPSVIFYNILTRSHMHCRSKIADLSTLIMRHVSRNVSQSLARSEKGNIVPFNLKTSGESQ